MPTLQLYDTLLGFPLFKGMGHDELSQLVSHTKFDFVKLPAGNKAVRRGANNSRLMMLANGGLEAVTYSSDMAYCVRETINPPYIIEPERLFGLHQSSKSTFTALTDTNIIAIDKTEVARLCDTFMAFRLNMLNLLATEAQRRADIMWISPPADLRGRIARFIGAHCLTRHGRKEIQILMERLAAEVNDSRLDVSHALRAMREDGLISTSRGRIIVEELERLS